MKASRIKWIEQQLEAEQQLKDQHQTALEKTETTWRMKINALETVHKSALYLDEAAFAGEQRNEKEEFARDFAT